MNRKKQKSETIDAVVMERFLQSLHLSWAADLRGEDAEERLGSLVEQGEDLTRSGTLALNLAEMLEKVFPEFLSKSSALDFLRSEIIDRHVQRHCADKEGFVADALTAAEFESLARSARSELVNLPRDYRVRVPIVGNSPGLSLGGDERVELANLGSGAAWARLYQYVDRSEDEGQELWGLELELGGAGYLSDTPANSLHQDFVRRSRQVIGLLYAFGDVQRVDKPILERVQFGLDFVTGFRRQNPIEDLWDDEIGMEFDNSAYRNAFEMIPGDKEPRSDSTVHTFTLPPDEYLFVRELGVVDELNSAPFLEGKLVDPEFTNVVQAAEWLTIGVAANNQSLQLVSLATGIETIFSSDASRSDGPHGRILDRCAYLLGSTRGERKEIREQLAGAYDVRSQLLHQGRARQGMSLVEASRTFIKYLVRAIKKELEGAV